MTQQRARALAKVFSGRRGIAGFTLVWLSLIFFYIASPPVTHGVSSGIVISQVYGGGGNAGSTLKNDFIELFNLSGAPVTVTGWSVQYTSAAGTTWQTTALSGTIQPGHYYLVQESQGAGGTTNLPAPDATGNIAMSATVGKVALVNGTTALSGACPTGASIVDFIGYGTGSGGANCFEGATAAPTLTNTTADLRAGNGCTDTDSNSSDFTSGTPNPRNSASVANVCGGPPVTSPTGVGNANPSTVAQGGSVLLTVTVTPGTNPASTGITVTANLTSIGGSASQAFFDDGTNGDVTMGDNIFSFQTTVGLSVTSGGKNLPATIHDGQGRTGSATISLTVPAAFHPIHDIQGPGDTSPLVGQVVQTSGIVTGIKTNGFFIQAPDAEVDADPNTSEGVFVFTSTAPSPTVVAVGNLVSVTGTVAEFIPSSDPNSPPSTEISGTPSVSLMSTGNPLPTAVTLTAADTNPAGPIDQLEKYEGMRVHVASLTVVSPTDGTVDETNATSTSNGVFYGVITGVARPFLEPGIELGDPLPPGSPCCIPRFDTNPERIQVDTKGFVGSTPMEVTTGAVVTNLTGPLDFSFRIYTILSDPSANPVATGNISAIPVAAATANEFTVASCNMERFFDTVNDPSKDDVALTPTAFNNRLNKASIAIRTVLMAPDVIGVEEMENLTTLQALATKINNDAVAAMQPNPGYQAFLVEGNDVGGIDVGLLVKSRVTVVDVTQFGLDTTYIDPGTGQPAELNDRPPLVLRATIPSPAGTPFPVTIIVNHLRSLSGVDDPTDGGRVRAKRRAQAEYLANLIQARQVADPTEHIISVGDYNAFQFNDGYVDVMGTIKGTPTPSDQVVLASSALVNPVLTDLVEGAPANQRYSFMFNGDAQELDHVLVSQNMTARIDGLHWARLDADFPETFRNDPNRPERISDHDWIVANFSFPSADLAVTQTAMPEPVTCGSALVYNVTVSNNGTDDAASASLSFTMPAHTTFQSIVSPSGWTPTTPMQGSTGPITAANPVFAANSSASFTIMLNTDCTGLTPNTSVMVTATSAIQSSTDDPNPMNNSKSTMSTINVGCPAISVGPASIAQGTAGVAYAGAQFTQTGGSGTITFNESGTLPIGLMLSSAGALSGTPLQTGTFPITVTATDQNGCTGSQPYSLMINCATISVGPANIAPGVAGTAYFGAQFAQAGGVGTITFTETGALPTGMTLSSAGALAGTPQQSGSFPITVKATDQNGCMGTQAYTLVINCPTISVGPASIAQGTTGIAYSGAQFTETGGVGTITFTETGALPTGMMLSSGGALTGTPQQSGTFPITVKATDQNGCTGTQAYSLVISCGTIAVGPASIAQGIAGIAYSGAQFTQTGGVGTITFTETGALPTGMMLSSGGALSGTPLKTGSFPITVKATDQNGCTGTQGYSLVIGCPTVLVGPASIAQGTAGVAYAGAQFTQTGGIGTITFTETGVLPTGLTLSSGGALTGTPLKTGTFPITVKATDQNGCFGTGSFNLVINCPVIAITPAAVGLGVEFQPYPAVQFSQTGGVGPVTFSTASALPTGMTLSPAGVLSGTPTSAGLFPITATVTDSNGCTGSVSVSLTVTALDKCLKDNTSGDLFQFSSVTGDYLVTRCHTGLTMSGKGTLTNASGILQLTDNKPDRRVSAGYNTAQKTGSVTITLISGGVSQVMKITDTIPNQTCACAVQ